MSWQKFLPFIIILFTVLVSIWLRSGVITLEVQGRHAWRQSQTALNIRYFTREDFNILNPRNAYYNIDNNNIKRFEFPLMQWSIAGIQRIFGEHIFIVRGSLILISLFTLMAVYFMINSLFRSKILASIAVLIFQFFPVYLYQSINILPDNLALCFSVWFIYFFFKYYESSNQIDLFLAATSLCLASLCKLPFLLFGIIPAVLFFKQAMQKQISWSNFGAFAGVLFLCFGWYFFAIPQWKGNNITLGFFDTEVSFSQYTEFLEKQLLNQFPSLILGYGLLLILLQGIYFSWRKHLYENPKFHFLISSLLGLVFYFFFILKQIREGHDYYLYPFMPLFIILCIVGVKHGLRSKRIIAGLTILALCIHPIIAWERVDEMWQIDEAYFNEDFFKYRDELRSVVPYSEKCVMINDHSLYIVPYAIDKEGYIFMHDHLPMDWLKGIANNQGIKYLYSDSRIIEQSTEFKNLVEDTLLVAGSVKVFKLK